ncbi:hypothetical protein Nepgr_023427 [Nepenthes gracilis]|uniref:Uncharacterized protein n=1 Tax=Nepenthes gracilis TaxID=150966 RepID=A0AAD3XZ37_NEPGR|nr:hypothetical protein Nepgr_023427 [Nepenthes gracilis]
MGKRFPWKIVGNMEYEEYVDDFLLFVVIWGSQIGFPAFLCLVPAGHISRLDVNKGRVRWKEETAGKKNWHCND